MKLQANKARLYDMYLREAVARRLDNDLANDFICGIAVGLGISLGYSADDILDKIDFSVASMKDEDRYE